MDTQSPIEGRGPMAVLCRFLGAAFFGVLVDVAIFVLLVEFLDLFGGRAALIVLIAVPLAWGVLGIFFFERMLCAGRDLVEGVVDLYRW
jgi:hypothetical protein